MEPELAAAYERCRQIHRRHGRTYYLATRLLPAWKRPHVHALYALARYADDIVDSTVQLPVSVRSQRLHEWSEAFLAGLAGEPVDDPLLPAVLHTIRAFDLDRDDFASFFKSMAMDLDVATYGDYDELLGYMEGSAAVIGTMVLPILGPADPAAAREPARQLGLGFQLTNFIRDVAEDLDRGRVYLPLADLDRFGLTVDDLREARAAGRSGPAVRALVEFESRRAWEHYEAAAPGVTMLPTASQACVRTAFHLYSGILDEVAAAGYEVFAGRAVVPRRRRVRVAVRSLLTRPGTPAIAGPVARSAH